MTDDPYDQARFVRAQAGVFDQAVRELRAGRKRSHGVGFVFPQLTLDLPRVARESR